MHFYALNSKDYTKLYIWEVEELSLNERFKNITIPLYWFFEEVPKYPTKQIVYARAIIPHTRNNYSITTTFGQRFLGETYNIVNPNSDLGLVAIEDDKWYKVIGDKPIKTFYIKTKDRALFQYFSKEGKLNEFIKYEYRGN